MVPIHQNELNSPEWVEFIRMSWIHQNVLNSPEWVEFTRMSWIHQNELNSPEWVEFTRMSWIHQNELNSPEWVEFIRMSWIHQNVLNSPEWVEFTRMSWIHQNELNSSEWVEFTRMSWIHQNELNSPEWVEFTRMSWIHQNVFNSEPWDNEEEGEVRWPFSARQFPIPLVRPYGVSYLILLTWLPLIQKTKNNTNTTIIPTWLSDSLCYTVILSSSGFRNVVVQPSLQTSYSRSHIDCFRLYTSHVIGRVGKGVQGQIKTWIMYVY